MKGIKEIISGKEEIMKLNNHNVVIVRPEKKISLEEGMKEFDRIVAKIKKR